ncbi:MAG: hypothetical protein EAZ92_16645 [Candidatus Kapaibacterium sp.]|nr:MAG: hypothetical protein EAZ92_16645 [Candidatus Kapabacteria bacterium]
MDESLLIPINLQKALGDRRSFISDGAAERVRLEYFKHTQLGQLVARAHFGAETEGPPGLVHSAAISGSLLEAMIFAAWSQGCGVLSMRFSTAFKQMLPLHTSALIDTALEMDGPRLTIRASLTTQHGMQSSIYAEAEGLFMAIPASKFGVDGVKVAQMFAALS